MAARPEMVASSRLILNLASSWPAAGARSKKSNSAKKQYGAQKHGVNGGCGVAAENISGE